MRFAEMAKEAGLPRKPFYLVSEIARATGWPESTVYGSMAKGDLRKRLPAWKKRGRMAHVEDIDEWLEGM